MTDISDRLAAAGMRIKPLVWKRSHISGWNDDYHTVPTGYVVRCADEYGWKWKSCGGAIGYAATPGLAKVFAENDHNARILAMIEAAK